MDYGKLFSRAWQLVWQNKFMFVLGFLAALGSGGGGGGNSSFQFGSGDVNVSPELADNLERLYTRFAPLLFGLICLVFILLIAFWLIRLAAQAGLISAAVRLDAGEKVTFGEAFSVGLNKLGAMIGIHLLLYGPFILIGILSLFIFMMTAGAAVFSALSGTGSGSLAAPEALAASLGIFALCFGLLACLLIPLWLLVTVIYPFAQRSAVLQGLGVTDSIRRGWAIVRANVGDVALLVLFFIIISFAVGLVTGIILLPLAFLALGPAILGIINQGTLETVHIVQIVAGGVCLGVVAAIVQSILIAFRSTAVTLAHQEFIAKTA
jgi:hypothetical protein